MFEKLEAIVLGKVKYSDRHDILNVYTRQHGRMAFLYPARKRKGLLPIMPLSLLEIDAEVRPMRELQAIPSVALSVACPSIYADPLKSCIALFMADFINKLLRESQADEAMWAFLKLSVKALDIAVRGIANFHIAFLWNLTRYAGILPDISGASPHSLFSMESGAYIEDFAASTLFDSNQFLTMEESVMLPMLARINYRNIHLYKFNRTERSRILDLLLAYYGLHYPGMSSLKSLDVLRSVFS